MIEKTFNTAFGKIHYWTVPGKDEAVSLVFLPGLSADHRLFDKQVDFFKSKFRLLVWDAPAHGKSKPFSLKFSMKDCAEYLHEILQQEQFYKPIIIGQSMGAYIAQEYMRLFPDGLSGFISIDSAPLKRKYMSSIELWTLKHVESIYRMYPWNVLLRSGARGCAQTGYGRKLMKEMMESYSKNEYCSLVGHAYRILANAIDSNLPYSISCPTLLICGKKDKAGLVKLYNKAWAKGEQLPIQWIENAGHNSNTDQADCINQLILDFCLSCQSSRLF